MTDPRDAAFMEMAYGLAETAAGRTLPNPCVGAVIVKDGRVVGHGFHEGPGLPHAEIVALRRAGARAKGATLYVTLEPCVHQGRTPPCVGPVLRAGFRRIVISAFDANPRVMGRGALRLGQAGLDVDVGLLAERHARLNAAATKFVATRRPLVTLKAAVSLDGKLAARTGDARWISSAAAREYMHLVRAENDAILVGLGTVLADDPRLTVRHPLWPGKRLTRIVLDAELRTPPAARLLRGRGGALIFARKGAPAARRRALGRRGAEIIEVPGRGGRLDLDAVLAELGRREIAALLVEGGGRVHTSFLEARLADKAIVTVAPLLVGGRTAPALFGGAGAARLADALALTPTRSFRLGADLVLEGSF